MKEKVDLQHKLAVFFTSYLIIARRCSGGKHCKSNLSCTIVTFLATFIIPMFATKIVMSRWGMIAIGMIEIVLIFILIPYIKPEEYTIKEQRMKRKLISVIAFCGFIGIAYLIGGDRYTNGIFLTEAIVIFATIK